MNNFVVILGSSGNGKSSSIKSLDPKETFIINVLNKNLPFKGSKKNYNKDNKNITSTSNWDKISKLLTLISDKYENVKNIVIDDAIYIMRTEFFDRSGERGYDKYNELADHFRKIISKCNSLREDITVFLMLHTEAIETSGDIKTYKASTVGKLLDKMYDPLENTTITLFCQPQFDDATGKPTYGFYTHKIRVDGIEIPAKTPDGMFEEDFIPNDLQIVLDNIKTYYEG
jgi:hypothetical protein